MGIIKKIEEPGDWRRKQDEDEPPTDPIEILQTIERHLFRLIVIVVTFGGLWLLLTGVGLITVLGDAHLTP